MPQHKTGNIADVYRASNESFKSGRNPIGIQNSPVSTYSVLLPDLTNLTGHIRYEVFLRPTTDFKAHLMSRGGWLQVVSPKSLAKEILEWHQEAIDRYAKPL